VELEARLRAQAEQLRSTAAAAAAAETRCAQLQSAAESRFVELQSEAAAVAAEAAVARAGEVRLLIDDVEGL
jgi:chromosomal replication initiation ATPase DnaA